MNSSSEAVAVVDGGQAPCAALKRAASPENQRPSTDVAVVREESGGWACEGAGRATPGRDPPHPSRDGDEEEEEEEADASLSPCPLPASSASSLLEEQRARSARVGAREV
jgi:hypothetical protein